MNNAESFKNFKRVEDGEEYYYITLHQGAYINRNYEDYEDIIHSENNEYYHQSNNYFKTPECAIETADKIAILLMFERFHDTYCQNYVPDWKNKNEEKYQVYYNYTEKEWCVSKCRIVRNMIEVYFPTEEIAQKVCNILNAEKEN